MSASFLLCVEVLWTILPVTFRPQQESVRQVQELVERLRSDKVEDREVAARRLKGLGKAALEELEKASRDKDPEVSSRAHSILKIIAFRETLPPGLRNDLPGVEDRLAEGGHSWTEVLLEVIRKDSTRDISGKRIVSDLMNESVNALVVPALREARTAEEKVEICNFLASVVLAGPSRSSSVSGIARLIKDEDLTVRNTAIEALRRLGANETAPEIVKLLKDEVAEVRSSAASSLCGFGLREGVAVLLEVGGEEANVRLGALHAIRQPELWGRLGRIAMSRVLEGTFHELAEGLGREAGLPLVIPAKVKGSSTNTIPCRYPDQHWRRRGQEASVLKGLEMFMDHGQCEMILEPDRIRILPREEALGFRLAWRREEEKKQDRPMRFARWPWSQALILSLGKAEREQRRFWIRR
ncbi:MAG: HEAT repeat domain-containing protein [Acidobacteria bacterium]|nr:HEAT repeat domain-containing protein [Acidobacteriota bacterium]